MKGIALSLAVLLASGLRADDTSGLPVGFGPVLFKAAARVEGDRLTCQFVSPRQTTRTEARTVIKDGKRIQQMVEVPTTYFVSQEGIFSLKETQVYITGKKADPTKLLQKADPAQLADLLGKNPPGLMVTENVEKVTSAQLKDVKEGTVILVLPKTRHAPPSVPPLPPGPKPPPAKKE
jgi:hypothetical protein